ncbi:MAG: hypothetical protein JST82_04000 [Bacteroidetes bacterium]|nr:hypothetical protein [Bacteroidota bacterium]
MRKIALSLSLLCCILSYTVHAQDQPQLGCDDKAVRLQAEQIKRGFMSQGLTVYKDAMITMESRQPTPIGIQMMKGKLYQFIYVGSKESRKIVMEMYDGQDTKLDERIIKDPINSNVIVYSFVPDKTDMYLIVLSQVKGSKSVCGNFTVMETPGNSQPTKPATNDKKPNTNPRYIPPKQ